MQAKITYHILSRWLKKFNISLASERRKWRLAVEATGYSNLTGEMLPHAFPLGKGKPDEFHVALCVHVPNLNVMVAEALAQHQGYIENFNSYTSLKFKLYDSNTCIHAL